jgi:protein arginine kinase activator
MKCDNCGKEEVNFHYTSNINGTISEKHLCAECATKIGIEGKPGPEGADPNRPDMSFEEIFADLFGMRPNRRMFGGYGMMLPTFVIPTVGVIIPTAAGGAEAAQKPAERPAEVNVALDEEMKKRRELNILRAQMAKAAEAEDYEKAAALRDSIRRLENG